MNTLIGAIICQEPCGFEIGARNRCVFMKPLRKLILGTLRFLKRNRTNACQTGRVKGGFPALLIVLVSCIFTMFSPGRSLAQMTYVGNTLTNNGAGDTDPPLVILGEYNPFPSSSTMVTLPAGVVEDVRFYGGTYGFTLYALSWVSNPPPGEQTFQVVASEFFTNTVAVAGLQTNAVTGFMVNAGDFLAFRGTGPYYVASPNGLDATYESLGFGNPYTATNPGSIGTTFTVGTNGNTGADYEYIPPGLTLPSRTYSIGADVLSTNGYNFIMLAGQGGINGTNDGLGTNALFNNPESTAVASNFDIFVADTTNNLIRKVSTVITNWLVTTIAGSNVPGHADGVGANAQFNGPQGVAVTSNETVFVADTVNDTIRMLTPTNNNNWAAVTIAGIAGTVGTNDGTNVLGRFAKFNGPSGIAVDIYTNVFVADTTNHTIRKLTFTNGVWAVTTIAGLPGIAGSADGSNSAAQFRYPEGIAVDAADNLFVADSGNNEIRKITRIGNNWVVTSIAGTNGTSGSADGTGTTARFDNPGGVAVDFYDDLFVADSGNDTVRAVVPFGANWIVTTIGGLAMTNGYANGVGPAARFTNPRGICVNGLGDLFVDGDVIFGGISPLAYGNSGPQDYTVQIAIKPQSADNVGAGWRLANYGTFYPGMVSEVPNSSTPTQTTNGQPILMSFTSPPGWTSPAGTVPGITNITSSTEFVAANLFYTPGAQLIFTNHLPDKLWMTGTVGTTYYIQYNTNLMSNVWVNINPNPWSLAAGINFITNWPPPVPAGRPAAFYRAKFSGQ